MWYEILPAVAVINAITYLGLFYLPKKIHTTFLPDGKKDFKLLTSNPGIHFFLRDERLTGNPYVVSGLESVADEPPTNITPDK